MALFDPDALVAMLTTSYPAVSAAAFALARQERPEFFGDGVIFGSKGDKLRLPDARAFDCIVAAGGPPAGRRWQCALIDPTAPGSDDPFALEEGPLVPLEDTPFEPRDPDRFQNLVGRELGDLGDWDSAYETARTTAIDAGGGAVDVGDDPDLIEGADALENDSTHRRDVQPVEELAAIAGLSPTIDDRFTEVGPDPDAVAPSEVDPDRPGRGGKDPNDPGGPTHEPPGGHH